MENAEWARAEEDVGEVDLGLGTIAQLDICTGTAICTRCDPSASDPQHQEGHSLLWILSCWLKHLVLSKGKPIPKTTYSR